MTLLWWILLWTLWSWWSLLWTWLTLLWSWLTLLWWTFSTAPTGWLTVLLAAQRASDIQISTNFRLGGPKAAAVTLYTLETDIKETDSPLLIRRRAEQSFRVGLFLTSTSDSSLELQRIPLTEGGDIWGGLPSSWTTALWWVMMNYFGKLSVDLPVLSIQCAGRGGGVKEQQVWLLNHSNRSSTWSCFRWHIQWKCTISSDHIPWT